MVQVTSPHRTTTSPAPWRSDGFSLIEVLVSMGVLTAGLLSLVGVFTISLWRVSSSSTQVIAREKAREAIESVHAARDTGLLSWQNIQNVASGGIFLAGDQPLKTAGADGIVNTADDAAAPMETMRKPGPDGTLGTVDDEVTELNDFTREIVITNTTYPNSTTVNPNLRRITVHVRFRVYDIWRTYTVETFISSYS
jgi:type II secretory pathway pseudopilin PulG